jgi:hypothetical protein
LNRAHWSIPLAVFILALLPRVGPALRSYNPSNDAAEYLLIARSLANGDGFTLPIKVRFDTPGPVVHEAYGERAPLFPWLLSVPAGWDAAPGWPNPALQLINVALAALAALLASLLTADLARRRGLRGRTLGWAAFLGGLAVAWYPNLVRASIHLWAEPLSLVLVLAALRHYLALEDESDSLWPRLLGLGVLAGAARFARPEAWVLSALFPVLLWRRGDRRGALRLFTVLAVLNTVGIWVTGVLAPQLGLLSVQSYTDLMSATLAAPPGVADVTLGVAGNTWAQLEFMLLPKNAFVVFPLALLGLRSRAARPFLLTALTLFAATAIVWSTQDASRFTIAPLCLVAPVAAVEVTVWRRRLFPHNRWALILTVASWSAIFAHRSGKEARKPPPIPAPVVSGRDPWADALLSGRPAKRSR